MIRQICWNEKDPTLGKTEIRVDFFARDIKWQFKLPGSNHWNYDLPPSRAQWETLLDHIQRRYQRGRARIEDLRLVQRKLNELHPNT